MRLDELAEDRKTCPVCTEAFSGDDRPMLLDCGHLVGRECIERWVLSGHNSCPMCRAAIFGWLIEFRNRGCETVLARDIGMMAIQ